MAEEAVLTVRSDRRLHRPYGIAGGGHGGPSSNIIIGGDGGAAELPPMPMEAVALRRGDVFRHVSAGGGGFGAALDRDPGLVLDDVLDEKLTIERARAEYGVVVSADGTEVDPAETTRLRDELRSTRES
jgi:N-methylhydantoinase B